MKGYFATREPIATGEYWNPKEDPDGNVRDRFQERDEHLSDIKAELAFLGDLKPGKILDIGCGPGFLLSALPNGWTKTGIEPSQAAVGHAREHADVLMGQFMDIEVSPASFDVVVMHHVIEHMENPVAAIGKVLRTLKPGGVLLLGTPDFDSVCARRFGANYRMLHDQTHISLFSRESMTLLLEDYGFIIDRVELPFFETRHFTEENMLRMFDVSQVSPPFVGNFMTFYCHKP
jgi:SAM-dependent methyltransferase